MSDHFRSRMRITSSFDQLQANRDALRRNVFESIQQAYTTADALGVVDLPDDPTAEAEAAFDKLDDTMEAVCDQILAKLEAMQALRP